ncbi:MAG TPA: GNAT family N-acetyltransferase [Pseudolabrys sp.]|nr:GNAT family N-acetyltransferase [Pseudolabrys sp.]
MRGSDFQVHRWPSPDRLDDILAIVHAAFVSFDPPSCALNETLDDLAARFRRETMLVAQAGRALVGSVFCARNDSPLYLTRLAVLPTWRGRGTGRALMRAAEEEARRLGANRLTLRVRKGLPGNRAYFERLGFPATGEGQDPGRPPYHVMQRTMTRRNRPPGGEILEQGLGGWRIEVFTRTRVNPSLCGRGSCGDVRRLNAQQTLGACAYAIAFFRLSSTLSRKPVVESHF